MKSIDILVNEHKNIKRVLIVIRKMALLLFKGEKVEIDDFKKIIDFIRNYADKHHHGKEEDILFDEMGKKLEGFVAEGPLTAMFSEHDLARLFVSKIEENLSEAKEGKDKAIINVISNSIAYADLLNRHIEKEDDTIYVYGKNKLDKESLEMVEKRILEVEKTAKEKNIQNKYIELIENLEEKYL